MLGSPATRWWSTITSRPKAGVLDAALAAGTIQRAEIEAMSRDNMTRGSRLETLSLMPLAAANSEEPSAAPALLRPSAGEKSTLLKPNTSLGFRIFFSFAAGPHLKEDFSGQCGSGSL